MEDELKKLRNDLTKSLQKKGWPNISYFVKFPSSSGTVDIVAQTKGFRKKCLMIVIAENEFDAGIASFLLKGIVEKGEKILYLQEGDPANIFVDKSIKVLADPQILPAP
ncbi:MAG: hypothetical protein ACXAC7_04825 [Candidatus Hodarchaeales archaeon]